MSNVAKLKKQAAEFEQKKQFDKALQKYMEVLQQLEGHEDEIDVALYNRVGDLLIRQNNVGDAVTYYEKAVDLYAEGGLFNNAIALCNKILRQSPGRTEVYYKLGKISAQKGFISDAKVNFLEYAGRKQKSGQIDEAFRALKEFADLCPDQDDIRLMLADQLVKANRKGEALDQLNLLYQHLENEGRSSEAEATLERIREIDPSFEPTTQEGKKTKQSGGLVFLDLGEPAPRAKRPSLSNVRASRALDSLPLIEDTPAPAKAAPPKAAPPKAAPPPAAPPPSRAAAMEGLDQGSGMAAAPESAAPERLAGLEPTMMDFEATSAPPMMDLELTTLDEPVAPSRSSDLPDFDTDDFSQASADLPMIDMEDGSGRGGDLPLVMPEDRPAPAHRASGELLAEMVPPLLQEEEAPRESVMDVSDLGINLGSETPSSGLMTPPFGAPSVGESMGFETLDLEPGGGSGLDPSGGLSADAFELEIDEAPAKETRAAQPEPEPEPEPELLPLPEPDPEPPGRRSRVTRSSTSVLAQSVDALRDAVEHAAEDWALRRQYAEALLDAGDRDGGLRELEAAMLGFERAEDLDAAGSVADEIIRLDPNSVRHHQKRVEYAFRTNDKPRLVEAYLQLADSLFASGQQEKSRSVYQRVLDLAPDDIRAHAALTAFPEQTPAPATKKDKERTPAPASRRYTAEVKRAALSAEPPVEEARPDDTFVNLGDWLRDDNGPKDTRMIVQEEEPSGDEQADFADMLKKFKQGISENVEDEDHESHYDLGVAYKEMGLLDEAISEFQKALRGTQSRVRTYEALGQCFVDKGQHQIATTVLSRAFAEKDSSSDDQLVGVLYLLGVAYEALQNYPKALEFYNRVFSVDIQFRDVGERIMAVEQVAR